MDFISIAHRLLSYVPHVTLLGGIGLAVILAHKNSNCSFNAYDYFIDSATGKASITKTLQVIAGLTGTWVIVEMAATKTLTVEFFITYLGALGVSEAWARAISAKYGAKPDPADK